MHEQQDDEPDVVGVLLGHAATAALASPRSSPGPSSRTQAATTSRAKSSTSSAGREDAGEQGVLGVLGRGALDDRSRAGDAQPRGQRRDLRVGAHADEHLERRDREEELGLGPVVHVDRVAGGGPQPGAPARRWGGPGSRSPAPGASTLSRKGSRGPKRSTHSAPSSPTGSAAITAARSGLPSRSVLDGPSSCAPIHSSDSGSGLGMSRPWRLAMETSSPTRR